MNRPRPMMPSLPLKEEFREVGTQIRPFRRARRKLRSRSLNTRHHWEMLMPDCGERNFLIIQEKSKLDALANLAERYEGFGGSVKAGHAGKSA